MTNAMIKIHNLETGEETERPMTNAEFASWQKIQDEFKFAQ